MEGRLKGAGAIFYPCWMAEARALHHRGKTLQALNLPLSIKESLSDAEQHKITLSPKTEICHRAPLGWTVHMDFVSACTGLKRKRR